MRKIEVPAKKLSYEQFLALVPEKFELNEGLVRVVRLAPLERWQEALKQVYGSGS